MKQFYGFNTILKLSVLLSVLSTTMNAQQYTVTPSNGMFVPVVAGTAVNEIEVDDEISANINIGFNFNYFGVVYTQVRASSNGFITFNPAVGSAPTNVMGSSANLNRIIAPLWDELSGTGGQASYVLTGPVGNKVFTMEWLNWRWDWLGSPAISFQVSFHEGTNEIRFTYRQEAGALSSPSASIGLVGTVVSQFFSLTSSASPQFAPLGFNGIAQKPATGQVYSFLPSAIVPIAPTIQATNILVSEVTSSSMNVSWSNGNGSYRAVFAKQASVLENFIPTNNILFNASSIFGNNASSAGNGWFCVYNGSGSSANVTSLQSGFAYRFHVIEYNGLANQQKYFSTSAALNPINTSTTLVEPSTPLSAIQLTYKSDDKVRFTFTPGDGNFKAIFMNSAAAGLVSAVDNITYAASTVFGSGSQIGSTGWFCVFNGSAVTDVLVTNLQPNSPYKILVVDYNGPTGSQNYNTSSEVATATFTTYPNVPITYNFTASLGAFTPLTGGTVIESIAQDDELAQSLPIGFTFHLKGVPFTHLSASSNGFLSFNPYASESELSNNLAGNFARPLIAPLWDDISGSSGQASYLTTGSAPNRIFTIEYLNWRWEYNASVNISFQVKLYEADNKIEYIYRQEPGALSSPSASIGIAFPDPGDFVSLTNSGAAPAMSSLIETSNIALKPVSDQVYTFTPVKLNQTITFTELSSKSFANPKPTFIVSASSTSGLPISYTSETPSVVTISADVATLESVGSSFITAYQEGNSNYNAATPIAQLQTVTKGPQTITFPSLSIKTYGAQPFPLGATSNSSLSVSYTSSNLSVATIQEGIVTIVAAGISEITATQSGNTNFLAATPVVRTLTVNKSGQLIQVPEIGQLVVNDPPFILPATASSGLLITYESSSPEIVSVSGNTVTALAPGSVNITATQIGDANFNAALNQVRTVTVKARQTIDFAVIPDQQLSNLPLTLNASSSSGLPIYFHDATTRCCFTNLTGNTLNAFTAGRVTVTAFQEGDASYLAAVPINRTFCLSPETPTIEALGLGTDSPYLHTLSPGTPKWFRDGILIPDSEYFNGVELMATQKGAYTVSITEDDCESEQSEPFSIIVTSLAEKEIESISVFPNPARTEITIDVSSLKFKQAVPLKIIDASGKTVMRDDIISKKILNVSSLKAGSYIIHVEAGKTTVKHKFIKQ